MYVRRSINVKWRHCTICTQVYPSKRTQEHQNQPRNRGDMAKFVKYYKFGHISSISEPILMFLGAFWRGNLRTNCTMPPFDINRTAETPHLVFLRRTDDRWVLSHPDDEQFETQACDLWPVPVKPAPVCAGAGLDGNWCGLPQKTPGFPMPFPSTW